MNPLLRRRTGWRDLAVQRVEVAKVDKRSKLCSYLCRHAATGTSKGITTLERVVEEGEGTVALKRDEPEGELGHCHSQGVDVHAVEAAVGHITPCNGKAFGRIGWQQALGDAGGG